MIELRNVSKRFPQGKMLFQKLNFVFARGDFIFITGPSGAGKTSLLHLIYGFSPPSEGAIFFENKNLYDMPSESRALMRRQMGFVFQDFRLISGMSVQDNISLPLVVQKVDRKIIDRETAKIIERMGLKDSAHATPETLSGGEQQKVAVARAVIHRPRWLFADEPTGNLDPKSASEVQALLKEVHSSGTSVVIATHDEMLIRRGTGTIVRLEHGTMRGIYAGSMATLSESRP